MRQSFEALNAGRYLEAVDVLRSAMPSHPDPRAPAHSLWLQIHPFLTGVPDMSAGGGGELQSLDEQVVSQLESASPVEAIAAIVERARGTRIVILNEAHHVPRDRAFALAVARALRPLGYTVLAAETFSNKEDDAEAAVQMGAMARVGYPRLGDGMYLKDPVFGDFVRQALALGYRPVAYEQTDSTDRSIEAREQAQAEHLVSRIFAKDTQARVFIYVGYSHAAESPMVEGEWMAARLKRMTGIDPLTIDQTTLSEFSQSASWRGYHARVASLADNGPISLMTAPGVPLVVGNYAGKIDLHIVHPRMRLRAGRPEWLWPMGREAVSIPPALLPDQGRRLVQAFIEGESADAIPIDQLVVEAGKAVPVLLVPPGKSIRFRAWGGNSH